MASCEAYVIRILNVGQYPRTVFSTATMLKRSRAPSPSPARADPSSPPPLDDNPRLPLPKRRRTVGPAIDSAQRRDGATEDDGEDDEDFDFEDNGTGIQTPDDKVYEHVNHLLHCLHAEHQHRSRSIQTHTSASSMHQSSHISGPPVFISSRDSLSPHSSPLSSPAKSVQDSQHHSLSMSSARHNQHAELLQVEGNVSGFSGIGHDRATAIPGKTLHEEEDERVRVTQRYEDTNRFVHGTFSVVL